MTLRELEDQLDHLENIIRQEHVSPRLKLAIAGFISATADALNQERLNTAAARFVRFTRYFEPSRN